MDTLSLDYNKEVAPVLKRYQAKSCDFALSDDAFAAECLAEVTGYISGIFGENEILWMGEARAVGSDGDASAIRESARFIPVGFVCSALSGSLRFSEAPSLRDDLVIASAHFGNTGATSFRFGLAGERDGTFDDFARDAGAFSTNAESRAVFRYHDPVLGDERTFVSFADEGYRRAFIYLKGAREYYYLDTIGTLDANEELFLQCVSPNALYLAASALPAPARDDRAAYDSYLANYRAALDSIRSAPSDTAIDCRPRSTNLIASV